jgi:hypothetical protein
LAKDNTQTPKKYKDNDKNENGNTAIINKDPDRGCSAFRIPTGSELMFFTSVIVSLKCLNTKTNNDLQIKAEKRSDVIAK